MRAVTSSAIHMTSQVKVGDQLEPACHFGCSDFSKESWSVLCANHIGADHGSVCSENVIISSPSFPPCGQLIHNPRPGLPVQPLQRCLATGDLTKQHTWKGLENWFGRGWVVLQASNGSRCFNSAPSGRAARSHCMSPLFH